MPRRGACRTPRSAWQNQRSASHRPRQADSISPAASRWCRVRARCLPPRTTCTIPASRSARVTVSRSCSTRSRRVCACHCPPTATTRRVSAPAADRPRLPGMLQAAPAARLEIPRGRRAQMPAHQTQHLLITRRQLLQTRPHGHTGQPGHDERRGTAPQLTHPATCPTPRTCRPGKRAPPTKVTYSMHAPQFGRTRRPTQHPPHPLPLTRTLLERTPTPAAPNPSRSGTSSTGRTA